MAGELRNHYECNFYSDPMAGAAGVGGGAGLVRAAGGGDDNERGDAGVWAVRISGPMFSTTEAGGITLGPSGDVFVAVRATAGERF